MSMPIPGWHPDPTGRHESRYWNGTAWTDHVADGGVTFSDPLEGGTVTSEVTALPGEPPPAPVVSPSADGTGPVLGDDAQPWAVPSGLRRRLPPTPVVVVAVVVVLAVVVGLVALVAGSGDDGGTDAERAGTTASEPSTSEEEAQTSDVFELGVGDCITDDVAMTGEVSEVPIIDCDRPHDAEVFHSYTIDRSALPDQAELQQIVDEQCLPAFAAFVGLDYSSSKLQVNYLSPTTESWKAGDRELLCLVNDPSGDVTGSLSGAKR